MSRSSSPRSSQQRIASRSPSPHTDDKQERGRPWRLKFHLFHHDRSSSRKQIVPTSQVVKPYDFTKNIPMDIPYPPFVNVEGVPNFRDMGGYSCPSPTPTPAGSPTTPQYSVRRNYVFRCSELSQISQKGNEMLTKTLGIHTLYDFRSEREAANPRGHPKGVKCISVPVFRQRDATVQMGAQQLLWGTAADFPIDAGYSQGYVNWYRQILEYGAKHCFRVVFEHIRDKPDEPVLYHCSAGKDRTGVFSALILKLCGVDNKTVAWEYSLTVPGMGIWEEAVEQEMVGDSMMPIRSHGGMTREEAHRICGSRASNMERFLEDVLDGEMGGVLKYLRDYCEFNAADVDTIYSHLVVPERGTVEAVELKGLEEHPQT